MRRAGAAGIVSRLVSDARPSQDGETGGSTIVSEPQTTPQPPRAFSAELRVLGDLVSHHRDSGQGAFVLIGGTLGMPPSGLVRPLTEAADGPAVDLIHLRCTGPVPPFGPLVELDRVLHPLSRLRKTGEAEAGPLLRSGGATLPRFVASLVRQQGAESSSTGHYGTSPRNLRRRSIALQDGFVRLFEEIPRPVDQPCRALFLEDVHAADEDTLEVLRRLASPPLSVGGLVFAGYRTDVPRPALEALRGKVDALSGRDGRFVHLRLSPMTTTDAAAWVAHRFGGELSVGEPQLAAWVGRCEGHPGRFVELVEDLVQAGAIRQSRRRGWLLDEPEATAGRAAGRTTPLTSLASLRPALRATLRRAAVLGRRFSPALLAQLEGREETAVLEDFQAAQDEGHYLVEAERETLVFVDEEIPRVLRDELLPPLRAAYAAKAASILERAQGRRRDAGIRRVQPGRIASLRELAEQPAEALAAHLEAAHHGERLLAIRTAVRHLRRARQLLEQGYRPAGREEDDAVLWQAHADLGRLLVVAPPGAPTASAGERREGLRLLSEAVTRADAGETDVRERAQLRATLGCVLAEQPVSRTEGLNQLRRARTLLVVGGRPDESWRYARHEAEILAALDDVVGAMSVFQAAIRYFKGEGADLDFARSEQAWLTLRASALRRPQLEKAAPVDRSGLHRAVTAAVDDALQGFREQGDADGEAAALAERAALLLEPSALETDEGDREQLLQRAARLLEEALKLRQRDHDLEGVATTRLLLGDVLAEQDRHDEAAAQYLAGGLAALTTGGGGVQAFLDRFPALGGGPAARARAQLETAAGVLSAPSAEE